MITTYRFQNVLGATRVPHVPSATGDLIIPNRLRLISSTSPSRSMDEVSSPSVYAGKAPVSGTGISAGQWPPASDLGVLKSYSVCIERGVVMLCSMSGVLPCRFGWPNVGSGLTPMKFHTATIATGALQLGQTSTLVLASFQHGAWKMCLHRSLTTLCPSSKSQVHIEQVNSSPS